MMDVAEKEFVSGMW